MSNVRSQLKLSIICNSQEAVEFLTHSSMLHNKVLEQHVIKVAFNPVTHSLMSAFVKFPQASKLSCCEVMMTE